MTEPVIYLTVEQIERIYYVSRRTVYNLANVHHWGRYTHPDDGIKYRYDQVDEVLAEGAERRRQRRTRDAR